MNFTKTNGSINDPIGNGYSSNNGYALSGKIMLSAIVILFTVVILFVCLHIYARWYLLRARRRHHARRTRRRTHIVFSFDPSVAAATTAAVVPSQGLDESLLKSLPTFVYSSATHGGGLLECAVCLSEFEEGEKGRLLPKCNHGFHIDCIDMWFQSHSTCPLCRTAVSSEIPAMPSHNETPAEVAFTVDEPESGPSYGLCPSCCHDRGEIGSSSSSSSSEPSSSSSSLAADSSLKTRRKTLEAVTISIEVPRRNPSFRGLVEEEELCLGSAGGQSLKSPGGQQGLKSPGSRILSLKRILSRERKGSLSPSSATVVSYSPATEIDLESGEEQRIEAQHKS